METVAGPFVVHRPVPGDALHLGSVHRGGWRWQ